ncbi:hypothetical protein [Mycolicibacterium moriokaense]|jgi:hypothetical protein|uniref:Uncharacterized protein n=1 Tax=Mycolicibacterium moriokaense TaxID=39691 RepID=A0AAD1HGS3_9MYCO|nr:hypothetical protein [Mycolicibacterium moriokaense]MCV7042352.1 hypothetical protein [Mycolicibacterium moriokaense]BBX05125.1 hypothetical protein MMOR_60610 [Mycolicibacterium moriokaense]
MTEQVEPTPGPARREGGAAVQVLVWAGIAAATVFIVAVVFFSGFFIGRATDGAGYPGRHHGGPGPGMMGPGMMGPGMMGPGTGPMGPWPPGQMGPSSRVPNSPPPPTTTATP